MNYSRLFDMNLITETITHPRIYPHVSDDLSPGRESFVPCDHAALYYLGVWDEGEFLGLWMFAPANSVCWEAHTCLLPHSWGGKSVEATIGAVNYIWGNTVCQRIITTVPRTNLLALRLAKKAGLTPYGVNERSFLKNGELVDQILLGISKPEDIQCH